MELLLGSYSADLDSIDTEIKIFINVIEDTDQYISVHLDSVRNEIIKMTLFMEVGGLVMGFGAFLGERSGMNLSDHVEVKPAANFYHKKQVSPWAFLIVCISIVLAMIFISLGFALK